MLTDTKIRNIKPAEKPIRLFDGGGLYLEVSPSGGKWWRVKYRFAGKEKRLSVGVYPDVSLKLARERLEEARKLLAEEVDPGENRRAVRESKTISSANSFEVVAREWIEKYKNIWAESHKKIITRRLENDVFPWLGGNPITEITAPQLLKALRRVEARGAIETAYRILQVCGQVFRYAIQTGRLERNPSSDLRGALSPIKKEHLAAITDPKGIGELLRAIHGYEGNIVTKCALRLAPLVFVRPGELRHAEWSEINLQTGEWNIPAHRMKVKEAHLVPLSQQAVEILKELQPLTGNGPYVFPSLRSKVRPMSNGAILAALRRMGYTTEEMTGHGFRAMARTVLDEVLGVRTDYIEHQLAHTVKDPLGRAYNRTKHLPERRKMMQQWGDYLDSLKGNKEILSPLAS